MRRSAAIVLGALGGMLTGELLVTPQRRRVVADFVAEGVRDAQRHGARAGYVEIQQEEMDAVRAALDRSRPGDLVVLCVDQAADVWRELEARRTRGLAAPARGDGELELTTGEHLLDFEVGL